MDVGKLSQSELQQLQDNSWSPWGGPGGLKAFMEANRNSGKVVLDDAATLKLSNKPVIKDEWNGHVRSDDDYAAAAELSNMGKDLYEARLSMSLEDKFAYDLDHASNGFTWFGGKIDSAGYSRDVTSADVYYSRLDAMEATYQSYRNQITENYEGDEQKAYLDKLDETYNSIFEKKVIDPLKKIYNDKLYSFKPDSEESMNSIKTYSSSRELMEATVSNYMSIQASKTVQYEDLQGGWEKLNALFEDKSRWHNTDDVKNTVKSAMDTYSAHRSWNVDSTLHDLQKAYADARAKELSDKYAEEHPLDRLGNKEEGMYMGDKKLDLSSYLKDFLANNTITTSNGMFVMDFSKIDNLKDIIKDVTEKFKAENQKTSE